MPLVFSSPSTISLAVALIILVAGAVAFAAVRANNRRLTDALNCMSQGLCMFDASARVVVCNQQFLRMYKLSPEG
jgi:PAS domain-containing protein